MDLGHVLVGRERLLSIIEDTLLRTGSTPVLLEGPVGVGKSAVLRTAGEQLVARGLAPIELRTAASSAVPHAAILDLLPEGARGPIPELFRTVFTHLASGGRTPIALIDDAHHLDAASLELVDDAVRQRALLVLGTVRTGHPRATAMRDWVDRHGGQWIEVPPLTAPQTAALAATITGGRIGAVTLDQLQTRSGGNPLQVQETVRAALETGVLHPDPDGTFRARTDLPMIPSLLDAVHARLASLPPRARQAAEILALGQPLRPDVLRRVAVDQGIVQTLDRAGILREDTWGLWLDHPLHAETVLRELPDDRRRRHLQRLLDAVAADPQRDRGLEVRLAAWQHELGGQLSVIARIQAARTAIVVGEFDLADDLLADLDGIDTELIRAEAASIRGAPAAALQRLDALTGTTEQHMARIALLRSQIHLIAQGRADLAASALANVDTARVEPALVSELRAANALVLLLIGRTEDAAALAREVTDDTPVSARITTLVATSIAEMLLGDLDTADRQADLGLHLIRSLPHPALLPFSEVQLEDSRIYVQLYRGHIGAALRRCRREQQDHLRRGGAVSGLWASMRGHAELFAGHLRTARDVASDAVALTRQEDPLGHGGLTMADQALATVMLGDVDGTTVLLEQLVNRPDATSPRVAANLARIQAWHQAITGETAAAIETAMDGAHAANDAGYRTWGLFAAHDAVRFGGLDGAASVLDVLNVAARGVRGGPFLLDLVAHAHAAAADDVDALERVATRLGRYGATLHAAEAYLHAAAAAHRAGDPRRAVRLRRSSREQTDEPAWTLRGVPDLPALTRRERQIADLAAEGQSNQRIADLLSLSIRTVENHLATVYAKLGISGRPELEMALGA